MLGHRAATGPQGVVKTAVPTHSQGGPPPTQRAVDVFWSKKRRPQWATLSFLPPFRFSPSLLPSFHPTAPLPQSSFSFLHFLIKQGWGSFAVASHMACSPLATRISVSCRPHGYAGQDSIQAAWGESGANEWSTKCFSYFPSGW